MAYLYLRTQCAAVRTTFGFISEPPQKEKPSFSADGSGVFLIRATIQGNSPNSAKVLLLIVKSIPFSFLIPQRFEAKVGLGDVLAEGGGVVRPPLGLKSAGKPPSGIWQHLSNMLPHRAIFLLKYVCIAMIAYKYIVNYRYNHGALHFVIVQGTQHKGFQPNMYITFFKRHR